MLALSQFVMTWALGWMYIRRADRVFDPLAERVVQRALEGGLGPGAGDAGAARRAPRAPTGEVAPQ